MAALHAVSSVVFDGPLCNWATFWIISLICHSVHGHMNLSYLCKDLTVSGKRAAHQRIDTAKAEELNTTCRCSSDSLFWFWANLVWSEIKFKFRLRSLLNCDWISENSWSLRADATSFSTILTACVLSAMSPITCVFRIVHSAKWSIALSNAANASG